MRKRIFAFFLAVVVAVGCVGYRPQKVYAEELLAVGACEVLYALLLSMGVVISSDASYEEKIEATQEFYNSMDAKGRMAFTHILVASSVVGDLYSWGSGLSRSDLAELWDSVMGAKADQVGISPAIAGYTGYPASSSNISNLSLGDCSDAPYVVFYYATHSIVYALLPSGYCLMYTYQHSDGKITVNKFVRVSPDTELFFNLKRYIRSSDGRDVFDIKCDFKGSSFSYSSSGGAFYKNNDGALAKAGVAWKGVDGAFIWGTISAVSLNYFDGVSIRDEGLMDCDTWADSMSRTGEVDKEVGVITGKDLSDYNSSEDAYDGLITGVNSPALPAPVDGDLGTIAGGLASILNWLKALPRAIASAVVGTGSLDLSKFNNIALSGVFPFCIPFDLINVFKSFNGVQPIDPKWVIDLSATPLKAGGQIVLDLTQFGVWISIVRYFCYASFVVGLIMLTRRIIKG